MAEPSFPPYNVGDLGKGIKRQAPAADRNLEAIADVLPNWLPAKGFILEIASGTGQHALAFAGRFPNLQWQPTDPDPEALASIAAWRSEGPANLLPPQQLDVCEAHWPVTGADAILCINMVHISPWEASLGLLDGAGRLLQDGAPLILYGPWIVDGVDTAPSNLAFDADLKRRDARWGLRLLSDFRVAAERRGLSFEQCHAMPSNNVMLLFRRVPPAAA